MPSQSVRFDASGEHYTRASISIGAAFTVLFWGRVAVDRASYATFWGMDAGDDNSAIAFQLGPDGILQLSSDSGTSQDLFAPTVGTWYCYALSRSAASSSAGTLQVRYGTSPGSLTSAAPSRPPVRTSAKTTR